MSTVWFVSRLHLDQVLNISCYTANARHCLRMIKNIVQTVILFSTAENPIQLYLLVKQINTEYSIRDFFRLS